VDDARLVKLEMEVLELKDMVRQALAILEANDRWNPAWKRRLATGRELLSEVAEHADDFTSEDFDRMIADVQGDDDATE
jgi:hypothetical protein